MLENKIHEAAFERPTDQKDKKAGWKAWIIEAFCSICGWHTAEFFHGTAEDMDALVKRSKCPDCGGEE